MRITVDGDAARKIFAELLLVGAAIQIPVTQIVDLVKFSLTFYGRV